MSYNLNKTIYPSLIYRYTALLYIKAHIRTPTVVICFTNREDYCRLQTGILYLGISSVEAEPGKEGGAASAQKDHVRNTEVIVTSVVII